MGASQRSVVLSFVLYSCTLALKKSGRKVRLEYNSRTSDIGHRTSDIGHRR